MEWRPRELNSWTDRMVNECIFKGHNHYRRKCSKTVGMMEGGCLWGFSDVGKKWGSGKVACGWGIA